MTFMLVSFWPSNATHLRSQGVMEFRCAFMTSSRLTVFKQVTVYRMLSMALNVDQWRTGIFNEQLWGTFSLASSKIARRHLWQAGHASTHPELTLNKVLLWERKRAPCQSRKTKINVYWQLERRYRRRDDRWDFVSQGGLSEVEDHSPWCSGDVPTLIDCLIDYLPSFLVGLDPIPTSLVNDYIAVLITPIASIINFIALWSSFPSQFKSALVFPLLNP